MDSFYNDMQPSSIGVCHLVLPSEEFVEFIEFMEFVEFIEFRGVHKSLLSS